MILSLGARAPCHTPNGARAKVFLPLPAERANDPGEQHSANVALFFEVKNLLR